MCCSDQWLQIMQYTPFVDTVLVACTCQRLQRVASHSAVWYGKSPLLLSTEETAPASPEKMQIAAAALAVEETTAIAARDAAKEASHWRSSLEQHDLAAKRRQDHLHEQHREIIVQMAMHKQKQALVVADAHAVAFDKHMVASEDVRKGVPVFEVAVRKPAGHAAVALNRNAPPRWEIVAQLLKETCHGLSRETCEDERAFVAFLLSVPDVKQLTMMLNAFTWLGMADSSPAWHHVAARKRMWNTLLRAPGSLEDDPDHASDDPFIGQRICGIDAAVSWRLNLDTKERECVGYQAWSDVHTRQKEAFKIWFAVRNSAFLRSGPLIKLHQLRRGSPLHAACMVSGVPVPWISIRGAAKKMCQEIECREAAERAAESARQEVQHNAWKRRQGAEAAEAAAANQRDLPLLLCKELPAFLSD